MKLTSNMWPLLAIVAGGLLLKKQKQTNGVGATAEQLKQTIVSIDKVGYGVFRVVFLYRGREYSFTTTNTSAIDRINDHYYIPDREVSDFYTYKQALQALYDEGKSKNGLA